MPDKPAANEFVRGADVSFGYGVLNAPTWNLQPLATRLISQRHDQAEVRHFKQAILDFRRYLMHRSKPEQPNLFGSMKSIYRGPRCIGIKEAFACRLAEVNDLPDDVLRIVIKFLSQNTRDRLRSEAVSKRWRRLSRETDWTGVSLNSATEESYKQSLQLLCKLAAGNPSAVQKIQLRLQYGDGKSRADLTDLGYTSYTTRDRQHTQSRDWFAQLVISEPP